MSLNRLQRRRRGVDKTSMNEVEFQAFLKRESETRAELMRPSGVAQAVRFAVKNPQGRLT